MKVWLKLGFKILCKKPLRAGVSFILTVAAFGIAGMCVFAQTYNPYDWEHSVYFSSDIQYVMLAKGLHGLDSNASSLLGGGAFLYKDFLSLEEELNGVGGEYALAKNTFSAAFYDNAIDCIGAYRLWTYLGDNGRQTWAYGEYCGETLFAPYAYGTADKIDDDVYRQFMGDMVCYGSLEGVEAFGYTLYGRLPSAVNEVAIPQWLYNSFLCYGYRDPRTGEEFAISSEEEIVGKTISLSTGAPSSTVFDAEIVGVIGMDYEAEQIDRYLFIQNGQIVSYGYAGSTPLFGIAVSREFVDAYFTAYYEEVYGDEVYGKFIDCIVVPRYSEHAEKYFELCAFYKKGRNMLSLLSENNFTSDVVLNGIYYKEFGDQMFLINNALYITYAKLVFPYLTYAYVLVPFAALLLIYYGFSTVKTGRRSFGIMRSLGANVRQIYGALTIPLGIFAVLCSVCAMGIQIYFIQALNAYLAKYLATYGILSIVQPFFITWQAWLFTFCVPIAIVLITAGITTAAHIKTPIIESINQKRFTLFKKRKEKQ